MFLRQFLKKMQKPTKKPSKESGYTKANFTDFDDTTELLSAALKLIMRVNFDLVFDSVILVLRWGYTGFVKFKKANPPGRRKSR